MGAHGECIHKKGVEMDIIELLKVIFLGIVEVITEWLPISSTGHMILVDEFLHLDVSTKFRITCAHLGFFAIAIWVLLGSFFM